SAGTSIRFIGELNLKIYSIKLVYIEYLLLIKQLGGYSMYTRNDKLVSNTYPAFLKTLDQVSKGRNVSDKLMNISEYGEFFTALNDVIKEVYDGGYSNQVINVYDDGSTLLFETD